MELTIKDVIVLIYPGKTFQVHLTVSFVSFRGVNVAGVNVTTSGSGWEVTSLVAGKVFHAVEVMMGITVVVDHGPSLIQAHIHNQAIIIRDKLNKSANKLK